MNPDPNSLMRDPVNRVKEHFNSGNADEVVRQSRQLILYPQDRPLGALPEAAFEGPVLMHSKPKRVPLNAYLACALTGLGNDQRMLVNHLSDLANVVCKSVDIDLYEPRKKTDPVHNPDVVPSDVFHIDRERVIASDLVIHLADFPSTGAGEELTFAFDSLVPMIVIAHDSRSVSRMITGIPSLKLEIRYQEPEDLREMLGIRLQEIRPVLEQRKVNVTGSRRSVSESMFGASFSKSENKSAYCRISARGVMASRHCRVRSGGIAMLRRAASPLSKCLASSPVNSFRKTGSWIVPVTLTRARGM